MPRKLLAILLIGAFWGCGEPLSSEELIARSIAYHDPDGVWDTAQVQLRVTESRPGGVARTAVVGMTPGGRSVVVSRKTETEMVTFAVSGEKILMRQVHGKDNLDEEALAEAGLDPERVMWLRNFYIFVWGLPMKLRDPGTIVDPEPVAESYNGQAALKVRVTYDPEVGGDTWYFYFHPETARMIGYRFYHDESANDGEYIHLEGEIEDGGLRLPAKRSWFFHSNDEYLGDDEAVALTVTP